MDNPQIPYYYSLSHIQRNASSTLVVLLRLNSVCGIAIAAAASQPPSLSSLASISNNSTLLHSKSKPPILTPLHQHPLHPTQNNLPHPHPQHPQQLSSSPPTPSTPLYVSLIHTKSSSPLSTVSRYPSQRKMGPFDWHREDIVDV
jgi:hypothetical protein